MPAAATLDDFEALLNESFELETPEEGTVVKGIVLAIEAGQAIIDIGYKMEGRVDLKEFTPPGGRAAEIAIGDTVEVYLDRVENARGEAVLSREKARREEAWDRLEKAYAKEERVEGAIFGRVKGGFTVDLGGAVAFLPGSQVDVRPVRDAGPLMHMPQPFQILKMDRRRGNIVVSRRAVLEESRAEQRAEIVARLTEGDTIDGVVKNITEYGAFVDLGGVDGLLHVTDMAWRRVNHPSEILGIGETVKVQVIKINKETQRISLGMKQLQADPWDTVEDKFPIGSKHTGRVTNITDYGAFVELEPGIEGLVHVSEMSWTKKNVHPGKIVSTSQEVEVVVLEIDGQKRRVSLGLKQTQGNPWENFAAGHPNGTIVEGEVKNITEFGLFVGLDGDIDGMVHLSDLDWNRSGEEAIQDYRKGDLVKAVVTDVDTDKERISLSIKAGGRRSLRRRGCRGEARRHRHRHRHLDRGRRHRGRVRRDEDLHPPVGPQPRPVRAAAGAVHQGRPCRRPRRADRSEDPQARAVDQGSGDRRGEGGGGAVRLVRLRRLARRHPRRGAEAQGQRQGRRLSWTRSSATSTRSGAASGVAPPSGGASWSRRCSPRSSASGQAPARSSMPGGRSRASRWAA